MKYIWPKRARCMGMYWMILVVIWASLQFSPSKPQLWVILRWSLWMPNAAYLGVRLTFAVAKSFLCHPKYVFQAPNQSCWWTESNRGICFKSYAKKTYFLCQKSHFLGTFDKTELHVFPCEISVRPIFCNFKLNFDTSWQKPWKICIIIFFIFFLFFWQHFFHFPSMKVFCSKNYQTITHLHLKYPILSSFNEKIRFRNNFFWAKLSSCWVTVPPPL